jgi:pimeloyl-ACP methyl ester carboxylesterase
MTRTSAPWTRRAAAGSLLDRLREDRRAIEEAMVAVELGDGTSLRVLDCGSGQALVLMPMLAELNFVYAPQIAEFQRDHRVILYEPCLGTDRRVGIADRAEEARMLLAALDVPHAHFVVWGDTGSAAYHLAKHYPQLCRSLVFIGLADRYRFPQPYALLLTMLERLPLERVVSSRLFATVLGRFVGGTQIRPEWFVEEAKDVPRLAALFKRSILPNLTEHEPQAGEVTAPSLLVVGDRDRIVSPAQAERMARLLPNAEPLFVKEGGEHFVSYVESDVVNEAIRRFLAMVE